jgi:hypothetical protein
MTAYLWTSFNHFGAVQRWANETGAAANLDVRDFSMEVKHRGRYYRMYPMFRGSANGRVMHLSQLTPDVIGFGGWRPYQTLTHPHSSDKKLFKAWLQECGLPCPAALDCIGEPPGTDYVLKERNGSFGRGLYGPYRGGTAPADGAAHRAARGELFGEQFVAGRMLKVWYWGAKPFFAHAQDYPVITGDGHRTVRQFLEERLELAGLAWNTLEQKTTVADCLAFQGRVLSDVLAAGQTAWIDYRYAQLYEASSGASSASDNQLDALVQASGEQTARLGQALAQLLRQTMPAPVVITVDGLLDQEGRIWWLEMNTNSIVPPEGYATMFADLFA